MNIKSSTLSYFLFFLLNFCVNTSFADTNSFAYEQTMNGLFHGAIASSHRVSGFNYFSADNFTTESNVYIKSLYWEGIYHPDYPKDNEEKGFYLLIFDNATPDENYSWNHPGNIIYSNFFAGYADETLESTSGSISLYSYHINLPEEILLFGQRTYWFSVQFSTSSSIWLANVTTDPVAPPVALQTTADIINGNVGFWSTNTMAKDLAFGVYGNFASENVYLIPEQENKSGYIKENIEYNIEICNCSALSRSFNLTYISNNWNVNGPETVVSIPPYESTNISVNVTIPTDALYNQTETSIVTAVCAANPALSNAASLTTKCNWYMTNSINIFTNNFDNWPPEGWTLYELGDAAGWTNSSPGANGTGACAMHSDNNVSNICDDWLVSPAYNLSSLTNYLKIVFSFDNKIYDQLYYYYSGIMISTKNKNPASNDYSELIEVGNADSDWTKKEIDLIDFLSDTNVYIAFRYRGDWSHRWYVDNPAIIGKNGAPTTGIDDAIILPEAVITNCCCSPSQTFVYASVNINGETGSAGPASNLVVEIGYGPVGTSAKEANWNWMQADYFGASANGSNDIFRATFQPTTYDYSIDYAFRARNGGEANLYIDSDGSLNGYSSNFNGKVMFIPFEPTTPLIYSQTLEGVFHGVVKSVNNNFGSFNFSADNFFLSTNAFINTIKWEGFYDPYNQRDGNEKGFNLIIFDNAQPNGNNPWIHPGNIIYSNFFNGYACEKKMAYSFSLGYVYRYQVKLPEQLYLPGNHTYWFCVQMVSSSSTWNVTLTLDPVNGPVALTTTDNILNGSTGNWKTNTWVRDMSYELYGTIAPNPEISVSPPQIDFGQIEVDSISKTNIAVANIGTVPLAVNASITNCFPQSGLMSLNWNSANIASGDVDYLELTINSTGFSENFYTCQVFIASDDSDNPAIYVPVSFELIPEPIIFFGLLFGVLLLLKK